MKTSSKEYVQIYLATIKMCWCKWNNKAMQNSVQRTTYVQPIVEAKKEQATKMDVHLAMDMPTIIEAPLKWWRCIWCGQDRCCCSHKDWSI